MEEWAVDHLKNMVITAHFFGSACLDIFSYVRRDSARRRNATWKCKSITYELAGMKDR